jgi:hypothetical protein
VRLVPLDFQGAEQEVRAQALSSPADAEEFFRQEFVRALFQRAIAAARADMARNGRALHFQLFEQYDLDPDDGVSYATLAARFQLTEVQVTNYLSVARRSFRAHALAALQRLCATDDEFRREARELFGTADLGKRRSDS